jgi:hypothetical protein
MLSSLTEALAPPPTKRAALDFEVEIDAGREGTWVVRYTNGAVTGKKGFAKNPIASVRLDGDVMGLLQTELQAAVDGYPSAPLLAKRLASIRAIEPAIASDIFAAVKRLKEGLCVHVRVAGDGVISVARGPVDEATRELTILVDGKALRGLLTGADPASLSTSMRGDRTVGTAVVAAMGPQLMGVLGLKASGG